MRIESWKPTCEKCGRELPRDRECPCSAPLWPALLVLLALAVACASVAVGVGIWSARPKQVESVPVKVSAEPIYSPGWSDARANYAPGTWHPETLQTGAPRKPTPLGTPHPDLRVQGLGDNGSFGGTSAFTWNPTSDQNMIPEGSSYTSPSWPCPDVVEVIVIRGHEKETVKVPRQ